MAKILIIGDHLLMAGAEKLMFELVSFAKQEGIEPEILIVDNYNIEYYDSIFKLMSVNIVRTRLSGILKLRNPLNIAKAIYWRYGLKYRAKNFKAIHVIGLYNVEKVIRYVSHPKRYFWHITNSSQYIDRRYTFHQSLFQNVNDTIIYINSYQADEIVKQYGYNGIKCKTSLFKLFLNEL